MSKLMFPKPLSEFHTREKDRTTKLCLQRYLTNCKSVKTGSLEPQE